MQKNLDPKLIKCHVCLGEGKTDFSPICLCCKGVGTITIARREILKCISEDLQKRMSQIEETLEFPQ